MKKITITSYNSNGKALVETIRYTDEGVANAIAGVMAYEDADFYTLEEVDIIYVQV